jgi:hypothetical protein
VAQIRDEAGLDVVRAAQVLGLLVELGVEREHAAVGVLELAIERGELVAALRELFQRTDELLILLLHLKSGSRCCFLANSVLDAARGVGADHGRARGEELLHHHRRAGALDGPDLQAIHQALRAEDADAHPRRRAVAAGHDVVQSMDAAPAVRHAHGQHLRPRGAFDGELDRAAGGVLEGVAGDLRDRRRHAGLVLPVEAHDLRDLSRRADGRGRRPARRGSSGTPGAGSRRLP